MILLDEDIELREVDANNDDIFEYCLKLAERFKFNKSTIVQLDEHFKDEALMLFEVFKDNQLIGIAYITRRVIDGQVAYTLDGYADDEARFKDSIRAGKLVRDYFLSLYKQPLFCAALKQAGELCVLLRKLSFKPFYSDAQYIYYKYENKDN